MHVIGRLIFYQVLARRGAVPVKSSTGNKPLENTRELHKSISSTGARFGEISALQYGTGIFWLRVMILICAAQVKKAAGNKGAGNRSCDYQNCT